MLWALIIGTAAAIWFRYDTDKRKARPSPLPPLPPAAVPEPPERLETTLAGTSNPRHRRGSG